MNYTNSIFIILFSLIITWNLTNAQLINSGAINITVYEESNGVHSHVFPINDPMLFENINKEYQSGNDFSTGTEFYDVYISDSNGVADSLGDYLTIDCFFNYFYFNSEVGNNIDAVELNFQDGTKKYASEISHYELGFGLTDQAYINSKGFIDRGKGAPDGNSTRVGCYRTSLTLGNFVEVQPLTQEGWRYQGADMEWSNHYPYPSTVTAGNNLITKFSVSASILDRYSTMLTGDVNGDGFLELVYVRDNEFKIFDYSGNILLSSNSIVSKGMVTLIDDVNGDGIDDIGIGDDNFQFSSQSPTDIIDVYARFFDANGNILKTFYKTGGYDTRFYPRAIVHNDRLLVDNHAGYSRDPRGWSLYNINTSNEVWYYDIGPALWGSSIADVNNDGIYEICGQVSSTHNGAVGTGNNGAGTQTTDGDIWCIVVDENGNEVFSQIYPSPSDGSATHKFVDFDDDGSYEILAEEKHDQTYYPGMSQLHLFNSLNGNTLYSFDGANNLGWATSICDVNNDIIKEIITSNGRGGQYIFDHQLNVLNSVSTQGFVRATNDLNGDGNIEIVLTNYDTLKVLDNNLNLIDYDVFGADIMRRLMVSDLDKNGVNEIILVADSIYSIEFESTTNISRRNNIDLDFNLHQNYPNPFNPATTIEYATPKAGNIKLVIFNALGQKVKTIINEYQPAGNYTVTWDGTNEHGMNVSSGNYFYQLQLDGQVQYKRMILVK